MVTSMPKLPGIGSHHSARVGTDEWLTPKFILDALGPFDLDPSTPTTQPWPTAENRFTAEDDGLAQPWSHPNGTPHFVWLNPPYSEIDPWMERLADHGHGIALIFARTETAWWFNSIWGRASTVLFLRGRLHFCLPDGTSADANAGGPSALVGYGREARLRLTRCNLPGALVDPRTVVGPASPVPAPTRQKPLDPNQPALFVA